MFLHKFFWLYILTNQILFIVLNYFTIIKKLLLSFFSCLKKCCDSKGTFSRCQFEFNLPIVKPVFSLTLKGFLHIFFIL